MCVSSPTIFFLVHQHFFAFHPSHPRRSLSSLHSPQTLALLQIGIDPTVNLIPWFSVGLLVLQPHTGQSKHGCSRPAVALGTWNGLAAEKAAEKAAEGGKTNCCSLWIFQSNWSEIAVKLYCTDIFVKSVSLPWTTGCSSTMYCNCWSNGNFNCPIKHNSQLFVPWQSSCGMTLCKIKLCACVLCFGKWSGNKVGHSLFIRSLRY